ncbi:MAG: UDP-N-acetylmuramoyl-tripeptide--D-alanyl-D-alanine ligase [Clostridiales bacterium]|nr:UDP-N-acetylmuramoyl-tripeptide--D-alanyl-D-alanine ligase [Clostridiales bacterium]
MKSITLKEVEKACGGRLIGADRAISGVSTDTRTVGEGDLFFAIKGERFDGHNFIGSLPEKKAEAFVSQEEVESDLPYVLVDDTLKALGDLAAYYRGLFDIPVVGITGSVGKTTTKDMIASVLSAKFNTVKTDKNFNNHIGLPMTVFKTEETTEALVLEMGMNHFGEISYLGKIAKPDIAVITNSGVSHIEYLGSREGILKAKCEIFESLKPNGKKVLNGDCDMLNTLREAHPDALFYGFDPKKDLVFAEDIEYLSLEKTKFTAVIEGEKIPVELKTSGRHMVLNALAAMTCGKLLGLSPQEIKKGIEGFVSPDKRMNIIHTEKYTLIDDTYNANPQSVKAGISAIAPLEGRKAVILGEMLELGEGSPDYHREVGEYAAKEGIDTVVGIGNENVLKLTLGASFGGAKKVFYYETKEEFYNNIKKILKRNDTVLIKASRGARFEEITEKLRKM